MDLLNALIARFKAMLVIRDRRGIAALEYALIASLIAVAIIGGITAFGSKVNTFFNGLSNNTSFNNTK